MRRSRRYEFYDADERSAARTVGAKLLPYVPAWALSAAVLPATALAHHHWGADPAAAPWAAVGLTVAGTALTGMTWLAARARGLITRAHATITVGLGSAYALSGTIAGVGAEPLLGMYLIGAPTLALSWNIRRMLRGDGTDGRGGWNEAAEKVGLLGAVLERPKIEGNRVTADMQLVKGEQTLADVQGAVGKIASLFGVPTNGVRVGANPDRADKAKLVVVPRDMLRKPTPWPGPSHPGGSAADPVVVGVYEDGEPVKFWLPGNVRVSRNATHFLWMGMNGAGKSKGAMVAIVDLLTRRNEVVWIADPVKGEQTFGAIKSGIDWFATSKADAKAMMASLQAIIRARADYLGRHGLEQWVEDCGLAHMTVLFEEAAGYLSDSRALVRLVQEARSVGISVWVSLQRASWTSIPTDAREQLGATVCFGVRKPEDAGFALSEHVIDSGADPSVWGNRKPGYAYLEAPGVDEGRWTTPLRFYDIDREHAARVVAQYADVRSPLDTVSTTAAGSAYAGRTRYATATATTSTATRPATATFVINAEPADRPEETVMTTTDDDDFDEAVSDTLDDTEDVVPIPANPEPGFMDEVDTSKDIPADDDGKLVIMPAADDTRPPATVARQMLRDQLTAMAMAGHQTVRPVDLVEMRQRIGRSPSWLTAELQKLVAEGVLAPHPDHGVYRLSIPPRGRTA